MRNEVLWVGSPEALERTDPNVDQIYYIEILSKACQAARGKTTIDECRRLAEQYIHDVNPGLYDIDHDQFDQEVQDFITGLS